MGDRSGISWTDATWNPVRGCSRVSAGCQKCYAEVQAARIVRMARGKPSAYDGLVSVRSVVSGMRYHDPSAAGSYTEPRWTGEVRMVPEMLSWPLRKRTPLRIFVNSMSDLFHEKLTNEQIAAVFGVMAACPRHTFQVLTKRAKRMREWFEWSLDGTTRSGFYDATFLNHLTSKAGLRWEDHPKWLEHCEETEDTCSAWPLRNVWLGVSCENQDAADERIPELLRTPAAVRFISAEPLLGPIRLDDGESGWLTCSGPKATDDEAGCCESRYVNGSCFHGIDLVIAGCESGPGARPCDVEWLRGIRDQCAATGVAFFCKQAVEDGSASPAAGRTTKFSTLAAGLGSKRKPGGVIELPYLDGVQWAQFPEAIERHEEEA